MTTATGAVDAWGQAIYGITPPDLPDLRVLDRTRAEGWGGRATVHNLMVDAAGHPVQAAVILPRPDAPVFLGLNFRGNHLAAPDPAVDPPAGSMALYRAENQPPEGEPDPLTAAWPISEILDAGFGIATACYLQLGPDTSEFRDVGLYPLLAGDSRTWGGIGMWAWFLSQLGKVLRTEGLGSRQIAFGHSRLGKAALWAAVKDPHLSGVVSIQSGCMGAAQQLTDGAETPEMILGNFPHWFTDAFAETVASGTVKHLPQHLLLASVLPRAVYISSADEDLHADPAGEKATADYLRSLDPAAPVGYHTRPGGHEVTDADWRHYLEFFSTAW